MTQPIPAEAAPVKDFSRKREQLVFRIDDDTFEAARAIPGDMLTEFAKRYADVGNAPLDQQLAVMKDALALVLLPESHARFTKRLSDLENPIELEQTAEVIQWLMGVYGKRPTQPSSPSPDGQDDQAPGTNSTDAQPPQASIPATFQRTAG
ncbi:MAG TPA: hypothetical protein VGA66_05540 [Mycobacterium sp.]